MALGVGWPHPNRSHFKAADQWATASPSGEGVGWLAAALDRQHHPGPLLALGPAGCPAMEGGAALALQLSPAELNARPVAGVDPAQAGSHALLRRMLALEQAGAQQLQLLRQQLAPLPPGLEFPPSGLGQQVALALRLIGSGDCPPVLQLAQGGYDTHADQAAGHGSASVALLLGDQWPDRLLGRYPSLSDLDDRGDLIPGLSPPELYRQVLQVAGV